MSWDCCCNALRFVFLIVNLLFSIAGITITAIGTIRYISFTQLLSQVENTHNVEQLHQTDYITYGLIILIGLGCVMAVIGFLGCCGALMQNQCLLGMYAFLTFVCMALNMAGFVLINKYQEDVITKLQEFVENILKEKDDEDKSAKAIQDLLQCCGEGSSLDKTCSYKQSCKESVANGFTSWVFIALAISGILQVSAFVCSLGLCCAIRKSVF